MRFVRRAGAICGVVSLMLVSSCAVTGVGVDGSVGVGYDGGYYEPYGYEYGGWGGGYRVAPWRNGYHRDDHPYGGGDRRPAYRPAPRERSAPSIPNRPRGH